MILSVRGESEVVLMKNVACESPDEILTKHIKTLVLQPLEPRISPHALGALGETHIVLNSVHIILVRIQHQY